MKPLAKAFNALGYKPVPGAEKYQFIKTGVGNRETGSIKIDILTGPKKSFDGSRVKTDDRRAQPRPRVGIHAHPLDEALTLNEGLRKVVIDGNLSTGETWQGEVFLPHPYTFLMMKIFAFRDRLEDKDREFGRYHAIDMYSIVATITEDEWEGAKELSKRYAEDDYIKEAGSLVSTYFSSFTSLGIIRLRESPYYTPEFRIEEFISALQEIFPHK
ncbi:MAG: hypothetical protein GXO97_00095 [Nitrospirae bacterium]|nr:hypothetical protein [Nitrospirota bacterium]